MCLSLWFFSFHRQHWPIVMGELRRHTPCIDDDDDGYDSPEATESWDDECNQYACFIQHRHKWVGVLTELGMVRPLERVEMEMSLGCNAQGEPRQQPANVYASFLEHKKSWADVMQELGMFRRRSVVEMEMLTGCNAQGEPLQQPRSAARRPTKLLDRRGRSLTRLNFY